MRALEGAARDRGVTELHLDTATNQPEAVAFYEALDYERTHTETQPGWTWTLAFYRRHL
jgi:ribosomal protein S18 acetylase RimI-like enzyme